MMKITNGVNVFEVTKGAYEGIYAKQGYKEVTANAKPEVKAEPAKSNDETFCEELVEKPIAQWSKGEIKKFCAIKKIDITGTKNADEAKDIIKEYLDKE